MLEEMLHRFISPLPPEWGRSDSNRFKRTAYMATAPYMVTTFLGVFGALGALDYLEAQQKGHGKIKGTLKVLGPAVLLPVTVAATTYLLSKSIPLAIAAGAATTVAETMIVGYTKGDWTY